MMTRSLLILSLLVAALAPEVTFAAPYRMSPGPPDTFAKVPTMCALPRGGFCSTGPFVRVGETCHCDGPQGRRYGEVVRK